MPPLKNIRHEKFAQEIIHSKTQTEAYKKVYPSNSVAPEVSSSRIMTLSNVRERILELMQSKVGTSPEGITKRLDELVSSDNEGIAMQAVNTGLKVYKMFEEDAQGSTINAIQIVFGDANVEKKSE